MKLEIQKLIDLSMQSMKTKMDSFIMNQEISVFTDLFLTEYLNNYFSIYNEGGMTPNLYLVVVNIDNISRINTKYTSKTGDETIRHLSYILNQESTENTIIFKGKGPGYILLVHDYPGKNIKSYCSTIQNAVKSSDAFIEPITVSCAAVHISEIDTTLSTVQKIDAFIQKASERINMARELPDNSFVGKDYQTEHRSNGKLLFVDNNPLSISVTTEYFARRQYEVTIMEDGVAALDLLKKEKFDAIIVDRFCLKIDGVTLKQYLNESSINMNSTYILLVHNKDVSIVEKANSVAIDYVISQPIIYEEIHGILTREMKRRAKCNNEL